MIFLYTAIAFAIGVGVGCLFTKVSLWKQIGSIADSLSKEIDNWGKIDQFNCGEHELYTMIGARDILVRLMESTR